MRDCELHQCLQREGTPAQTKKYVSELIILAFPSSYFPQGVVWCIATKEGCTMYDYMRALEDRFNSKPSASVRAE